MSDSLMGFFASVGGGGEEPSTPPPGVTYRGAWSSAVTDYAIGDIVTYDGGTYLVATPTGQPPNIFAVGSPDTRTFENSTGGWTPWQGAGTWTHDTTVSHSGVASLKVVSGQSPSAPILSVYHPTQFFSATAGKQYVFECWVRPASRTINTSLTVSINGDGSGGSYNDGGTSTPVTCPVGVWTSVSYTWTCGSTGSKGPYFRLLDVLPGEIINIDDLSVGELSSVFPYAAFHVLSPPDRFVSSAKWSMD